MKKFLSFVAAALVAFSFTACNGNDPASKDFKITISDVTATTAMVKIEPADTTATYIATYLPAEIAAPLSEDSLKIVLKASLDYAIAMNKAKGYNVTYADYLEHGVQEGEISGLSPKTEYLFVAVKMDAQAVFSGNVAKKAFTTPDIVVKETVDLGVLQGGGFEDYRSIDGSYIAYATDKATYDVTLNIYDKDFVGNFTEADIDPEYSYIWTSEMNSENALSIVKAELVSALAGADAATISGWAVASNGIMYKFSFTHPTVEAVGAPTRAAKKDAAKKVVQKFATPFVKGLPKF